MMSMIPKQTTASLAQRTAGMGVRALSSSAASPVKQENIGTLRFTDETAKEYMDDATYSAYQSAMWEGTPLDKAQKNSIAEALLKWSTSKGAVQYAHWFHPMRGAMAGVKCDAYIDLDFSNLEGGKVLGEKLAGGILFQGETDGSSFPNGGLRATHTAAAVSDCFCNIQLSSADFPR